MAGTFEIYVKEHFSAAHCLWGYPGDCARMHGHNWTVEVYVQCTELNEIGVAVDFRDIRQALREVLAGMDHYNLNELETFKDINPTSENIAKYLYEQLARVLNTQRVRVSKVRVTETPGAGASYWED